ncbi:MAG TPA: trypsin-like peptidase domain-containing protein [Actinomycetota bacterium]|nr:trypsin-like peptidase domain-containing protein [Actinomycetota bacterium]
MKKLVVLAALCSLLGACTITELQDAAQDLADPAASPSEVDLDQSDVPPPPSRIADVIEETLPSVVNVKVTSVNNVGLGRGEGSGVVIDETGVILTNFHVVAGAVNVEVVFNDGRDKMAGRVVGGIPERDLAVIRVDAGDLDPIEMGRSSNLRLGDDVLAIGFPLGLGDSPTVTKGIVSALDRNISAGAQGLELQGLLQTDAAINPGNSGGALIDRAGRLVGINTAAARASAAENVGFAIAIDEALPVIEEILSEPPSQRAWLGVSVAPVESASDAVALRLDPSVRGAAITLIFPDNPAEAAGLQEGDVIVRVGDFDVRSAEDLTEALARLDPGERVEVVVVNQEGTRTVQLTLAQRPPDVLPEPED